MRFLILAAILIIPSAASAQSLTGFVVDGNGAPIEAASVVLFEGNFQRSKTETDGEGRFSLTGMTGMRGRLTVTAQGFAPFERDLKNDGVRDFTIVLRPSAVGADVTVSITRTETRLSETPASVVVLSREQLDASASQSIDDSLRQIAGFTLFRRSSSKTTNPTAQGANLRGVSGSGASRAAVLFDGLSLNDAFGGWTYWSRVPMIAVEQAEVLRGGASSLYGSGGLSGAVNLTPVNVADGESRLSFRSSAGSQNTYDGSFFAGLSRSKWSFDLAGETFQTGGYIPIAENERGIADTRANSRHNNGIFSVERRFGKDGNAPPATAGGTDSRLGGRVFVRGNVFEERRDNGTSLTYNKTYFRQGTGGVDIDQEYLGEVRLRVFVESQVYDQSFSAVSADRNSETLSRLQRVPSQAVGVSVFWTRALREHTLAASFETREVRGSSDEVGYTLGRPTSLLGSGGRQRTIAFLVQDNWQATDKLNLNLGLRIDNWKNADALSTARPLQTNAASVTLFPDRDETAVSPRVAAIYQFTPNVSAYGSYARSFRAPTLNELYRGFRVGNIVTQSNENLKAEYADTLEGGAAIGILDRRLNLRGNVFVTRVSDPVVSVTLSSTPAVITRQRQNVGETRTIGAEVDVEYAIHRDLRFSASYLFADASVTQFPANLDLVGKRLPQVARQQATFQLNYRPESRFSFGIAGRGSGGQFEDDINSLRLRPYFTMDVTAAFEIKKSVSMFAAVQNVFNSRYDIGLTPNRTVAAPAFVRLGLRVDLNRKK